MAERPDTHSATRPRRRPPVSGGFTLVELLITIVISGVLVAVLAGAVAVVVRQESSTNDRVTDAAAAQMLALYFPRDVSSTPANARESDSSLPTGCTGADESGFNVLRLRWSETVGGTTKQYRVAYRLRNVAGVGRLARISCQSTDAFVGEEIVIARSLAAVPDPWSAGSAPAAVSPLPNPTTAQVTLTLTAASSLTYNAQGSGNNPSATLPATTVATPPPPPSTTTTTTLPPATTTTVAPDPTTTIVGETTTTTTTTIPGPCAVTSITAVDVDGVAPDDNIVKRYTSGPLNKSLINHVVITALTTGACANLRMQYFPKNIKASVIEDLAQPFVGTWQATIEAQGSEEWENGDQKVSILPATLTTPISTNLSAFTVAS